MDWYCIWMRPIIFLIPQVQLFGEIYPLVIYSGSLINGPTFNSANGGYITCDGTNDYIEVLDNSSLDFGSGSFTVEYWFRKLATTTGGNFDNIWGVNKWNTGASPGTNEWSLVIGNGTTGTGNQYSFGVESGSVNYGISEIMTTQLSLNTWYQLVGQRDGANFKTYLNGVLTVNVTASGFTTSSIINNVSERNLRINNSALNNFYTNADNAVVRIYNKALSPDRNPTKLQRTKITLWTITIFITYYASKRRTKHQNQPSHCMARCCRQILISRNRYYLD
jgi:hypothetical protein